MGLLDTCRGKQSDLLFTMRPGVFALMAIFAMQIPALFAQDQTALPPQDQTPQSLPTSVPLPPSPVDERDREIRQVDPLDHGDQDKKDKKNKKDKEDRQTTGKQDETEAPLPGSVAESQQSAANRSGPQVEDQNEEEPVQEYTGPAVLSRSYSINQALVPEQVKWNETFGVSAVYDTGIERSVNADGTPGAVSALTGTIISWGFAGKHYFKRDLIGFTYGGNWSQYSGYGAYNGTNQHASATYSHVLTRRLTLNLAGSGSIMSLNSILENQPVGPEGIANVNLASSPSIQIFDYGSKQMSMQADLTFQQTNRLSYSLGTSYFGIEQDAAFLLGMTGQQARADVNYRLTRKTTVGAYYSHSNYLYSSGFGNSDTDTFGGIYSYAFNRTTQVRFRGGISVVQSLGLVSVQINPVIAALLGESTGFIDSYATYKTTDMSAQFIKDFRHGTTASLAYAHGISPGNGVYQTSEMESISATLAARVFRSYTLSLAVGRDTLQAVTQSIVDNFGTYRSEHATLSLGRTYRRGVGLSLALEYRHFDIDELGFVRNQLRVTSGFSWGSGNGRLWPF